MIRAPCLVALAAACALAGPAMSDEVTAAPAEPAKAGTAPSGWSFNPDAGFVYQSGDFKLTTWGFAERIIDPDGPDSFRRFRQGAEFDFPRVTERLRPAFVYEIDLTDTHFFDNGFGGREGFGRRDLENAFLAIQDVDDPGRFRVLIGGNTHILSRDDNLSSGNLLTINRSLILEEHGSVASFGTQFGIQFQKALSDKLTLQLAAMDNRGSFNQVEPRYQIGNSLSAKLIATPINDAERGRKLTLGLAVDNTRDIGDRTFTLATAIGQTPMGGAAASGDKLTWEADVAYTFSLLGRPTTGGPFLLASPNAWNALGVGTTELHNKTVVYNHKRHGKFALGGRTYDFRMKPAVPKKLTKEFLLVDLVNNLAQLSEDAQEVLDRVRDRLASSNTARLKKAAQTYGSERAKKFFARAFAEVGALDAA